MKKKKVVLFGSIGVARKCLEEIILDRDIEFLGACCIPLENTWREEESVYEYCKKNKLPILKLEDVKSLKPDVGFSIRFNQIIKEDIIDSFTMGIFNTHGGILPKYRGVYSNVNALINGEEEYGVTLHYVQPGIDDGDIVAIKRVKIQDTDTGFSLYKTGELLCYEIISENIDFILAGSNSRISQNDLIIDGYETNTYTYKSTSIQKEIDFSELNRKKSVRIIRAFDSPYHEPAYTYIDGNKIYLRSSWRNEE